MREVAENVFVAGGTNVNWVLVREGSDLTVIDGGWYGDFAKWQASVRKIGRLEDVRAILLTHAHLDHMGAPSRLDHRIPIYASVREAAHARREFLEQATPLDLARRAWHHGMLGWTVRIVRSGAIRRLRLAQAQAFPASDGPLDLPGRPVPIPCPGHTSGHSAYYLPERGVLVSGDAIVTGHPLSKISGPQLLPGYFSHSNADSATALDLLAAVDADTLVPGHGEPWSGKMREAADIARERANSPRRS